TGSRGACRRARAASCKRILRAALNEIVARLKDGFVEMVLHWPGVTRPARDLRRAAARVAAPSLPKAPASSLQALRSRLQSAEQLEAPHSQRRSSSPATKRLAGSTGIILPPGMRDLKSRLLQRQLQLSLCGWTFRPSEPQVP